DGIEHEPDDENCAKSMPLIFVHVSPHLLRCRLRHRRCRKPAMPSRRVQLHSAMESMIGEPRSAAPARLAHLEHAARRVGLGATHHRATKAWASAASGWRWPRPPGGTPSLMRTGKRRSAHGGLFMSSPFVLG